MAIYSSNSENWIVSPDAQEKLVLDLNSHQTLRRGRAAAWRPLCYEPSDRQREAHDSDSRLKLVAGGERAGKSRSSAMELVWKLRRGGLFWIVGPDYEQCRPELQYVIDSLTTVDDIKSMSVPSRGPCVVNTKTGSRIVTKSACFPERLAGEAPDGILLCEAAQCSYEVFLRLRGRVAEKRGWLWLSGTFEGSRSWYADKYNQWSHQNPEGGESFSMPSWENLILYPGGYDDPEMSALRVTYPEDLFQERFGGEPAPPSGLVFREFSAKDHLEECPLSRSTPGRAGDRSRLRRRIRRAGDAMGTRTGPGGRPGLLTPAGGSHCNSRV